MIREMVEYGRSAMDGSESAQRGFTLVEIMIASVILAVLLIGIGLFFMNMIQSSESMDNKTRALELCQQGLEEIRLQNVSGLPDGVAEEDTVETYHRELLISTPYSEYPNAKLVTCRVDWTTPDGVDSVSLRTIY